MPSDDQKWELKDVNYHEWMNFATHIQHGNLMQSWEYGESKQTEGWLPTRYLLLDGLGNHRGLLQVLVKRFYRTIWVARINRGPILFASEYIDGINPSDMTEMWSAINRHAGYSGWWIISAAPELLTQETDISHLLTRAGLKRRASRTQWASVRLSLAEDQEQLMLQQNGKWRNLLRKGIKLGVTVAEVDAPNRINAILDRYERFQIENNFTGVPRKILDSLLGQVGKTQNAKIFETHCNVHSEISGFVVITYHFDTAMYLLGWTSQEGRKQQSNYVLLWQAIKDAKINGFKWFDMGGLTTNTPKGIAHFKTGVGGEYYINPGEFWSIPRFTNLPLLTRN